MDESDKDFRGQLTEAIANVRRQIEVDHSTWGAGRGFVDSKGMPNAIAALRTELASLEASLADLDAKAGAGGGRDPDPEMSAAMADAEQFNETHPDEAGVETADQEPPDAAVAAVDQPALPDEAPGGRLRAVVMVGVMAAIAFGVINSFYFGRRAQWPKVIVGWLAAAIAVTVFAGIYGLSKVVQRRRLQDGFQGASQPDIVS